MATDQTLSFQRMKAILSVEVVTNKKGETQMARYTIRFYARQIGSIGLRQLYEKIIDAPDKESARLKLYDTHEHISVILCELEEKIKEEAVAPAAWREQLAAAADSDPGERDEPPLCWCDLGYIGHSTH